MNQRIYACSDRASAPSETVAPQVGTLLQLADGRVQACDAGVESLLGYPAEQLIGTTPFDPPWRTIQPDRTPFAPENYPAIVALRTKAPCQNVTLGFYKLTGELIWLQIDATPLFQPQQNEPYAVVVTLRRAATQDARSHQILIEQNRLLELIATGQPLDDCLAAVCDAIARLNSGIRACFLLADTQRLTFPRSITPDLPPTFGQGLKDAPINELCIGTCGEAVYRGQSVSCADIENDDRWSQEWRNLCVSHGILACHSEPVMGIGNLPLGSLMLCFDKARMPTEWEYQLAEFGTQVASIAFERDRAEAEKHRSNQTLKTLIAAAPLPIVVITPDDIVQLWNPAAEQLFGWKEAEVLGQPLPIVPSDKFEECLRARNAVAQGETFSGVETYRCNHNGSNISVSVSAAPLRDEHGSIRNILLIFQNVTERQRAEVLLRQSEAEFRQLANAVPQIVWVSDAQGKTTYINDQWREFSGLTLEETANPEIQSRIFHPDDRERVYEEWLNALVNETGYCIEARMRNQNTGEYRWFLIRCEPFRNDAGTISQWFGTSTDITENKRRELQTAFLAEISQDLTLAWSETETMQLLGAKIGEFFDVFNCAFVEFDPKLETAIVHYDWYRDETAVNLAGVYPLSEFGTTELWQLLASGKPAIVNDVARDSRTVAYAEQYQQRNVRAFLNTPYLRDNQIKFSIALHHPNPYQWRTDEIELLQQLTERVWAYLERDRAQRELREAEAKLQDVLASVREDFVLFDPQWNIAYLNPQAAMGLRMNREEILGRNIWDLFPDLVGTEFYDRLHQVMRDRISTQFEYYYAAFDAWFENRVYPTSGGVVNLCIDITERKRIEAELRQKDAILSLINKASPTPIFVKDRQGRIIYANSATLEVLGRPASEVIGACDRDLYPHLEDALNVMENDQRIMDSGRMEVVEESPDGIRTFLAMKAPYRNEAGEVIGLIGISNDISERVQIERDREQVLQQEQAARVAAEQANRIKDEFLAVLSHELRTPMNPILGWSKLLQQGRLSPEKTTEALAAIDRNAKLQIQLIDDLLDISRILRGKLTLKALPTNLQEVIESAIDTVHLATEAKAISIQTLFSPSVYVIGDAGRLQQVVWNLLSNAIKFSPEHGQISITLSAVGTNAQVQVKDNGKGISPDFLPYIFEHFRQEDSATTRKFGGLGLGLAIARQIVELHGGQIRAESLGEGQGSTFTIQIPLASISVESLTSERSLDSTLLDLSNIRILAVDDEPDSLDFVAYVLEQAGAIVTTVSSGFEALEKMKQSAFDVIVSDIGMPGMNGYQFMQQIRSGSIDQDRETSAIALTAFATETDQQKAIEEGFQKHITKPIEPDVLVKAIADLVSKAR